MHFRNRYDVWGFVACVTGISVVLALLGNLWVHGAGGDLTSQELRSKQVVDALVTIAITLPAAGLAGMVIRRLQRAAAMGRGPAEQPRGMRPRILSRVVGRLRIGRLPEG